MSIDTTGMNAQQIKALQDAGLLNNQSSAGAVVGVEQDGPVESQRLRTALGQGLAFGFGDEIEAIATKILDPTDTRTYAEIRDEVRAKVKAYQQANPGEALTYEMLGAAAPTALLMLVPGGQPAATANLARMGGGQLAKRALGVGALEGGATAYGTGEEGIVQDIASIPGGAAFGAGTSVVLGAGGQKLSGVLGDFTQFLRKKIQGRPTGVVESELQRLMNESGQDAESVLTNLLNGRIMADTPELSAIVREFRSRGATIGRGEGQPRQTITEALEQRASRTGKEAQQELQQGLTPDVDGSVYKSFKESDEAFQKRESDAYDRIFARTDVQLSTDTINAMSEAFERMPELAEKLQQRYRVRGNIVPFFDKKLFEKTGELRLVRQPTAQDAEILRRAVDDEVKKAFTPGSGMSDMAPDLQGIENRIRVALDESFPDLAKTRANWASLNMQREQFAAGSKSLNKNVDELAFDFERLSEDGQKAFRAGVMNALRQKIRKNPVTFRKLSTEGSAENELLRTLYPEEGVDDVIRKLNLAADVRAVKERVAPLGQAVTADQLAARQREGKGPIGAMDIFGASRFDPQSLARVTSAIIGTASTELTPKQRNQIVDILFSESPEIVEKALRGGGFTERQMQKIGQVTSAVIGGATSATTKQAGQLGGGASQESLGPPLNQLLEYIGA